MPIPPIAKLPLSKSPWKQATQKWLNSWSLKAHTTLSATCSTTSFPNNSQHKNLANTRPLILEGKLAMLWLLKILPLRTAPLRKLWGGHESGSSCWWRILHKKWLRTGGIIPWMKKLWSRKKSQRNRLKKWMNNNRRKSQRKLQNQSKFQRKSYWTKNTNFMDFHKSCSTTISTTTLWKSWSTKATQSWSRTTQCKKNKSSKQKRRSSPNPVNRKNDWPAIYCVTSTNFKANEYIE